MELDAALRAVELACKGERADAQRVVDSLYESVPRYAWVGIYVIDGTDLMLGPWRSHRSHGRMPNPPW